MVTQYKKIIISSFDQIYSYVVSEVDEAHPYLQYNSKELQDVAFEIKISPTEIYIVFPHYLNKVEVWVSEDVLQKALVEAREWKSGLDKTYFPFVNSDKNDADTGLLFSP